MRPLANNFVSFTLIIIKSNLLGGAYAPRATIKVSKRYLLQEGHNNEITVSTKSNFVVTPMFWKSPPHSETPSKVIAYYKTIAILMESESVRVTNTASCKRRVFNAKPHIVKDPI